MCYRRLTWFLPALTLGMIAFQVSDRATGLTVLSVLARHRKISCHWKQQRNLMARVSQGRAGFLCRKSEKNLKPNSSSQKRCYKLFLLLRGVQWEHCSVGWKEFKSVAVQCLLTLSWMLNKASWMVNKASDAYKLLLQILILTIFLFYYMIPLKAHNLKLFRSLSSTPSLVHCSKPLHNSLEISSGFLLKFVCDPFITTWCCTNIILWLSTLSALIPKVFIENYHILSQVRGLNYPNPHLREPSASCWAQLICPVDAAFWWDLTSALYSGASNSPLPLGKACLNWL